MATERKSDRGILRPEQFRPFQIWLINQGHSVQEEDERAYWCSAEPKGDPVLCVLLDIEGVAVTSYPLREKVREFQDSLVVHTPVPSPVAAPALTAYEQDLRDDFAIAALDGDVMDAINVHFENNYEKPGFKALTRVEARYIFADAMLEARKK